MQDELKKVGKAVHMVVVNDVNAGAYQQNFVNVAAFPLFQDATPTTAWSMHEAGKDDLLVYDKDGKLVQFLPFSGPISTVMSTTEGWANVKNAILKAFGN